MFETIIYITGASRGMGAALAKHYAAPAVTLCLLANSDGTLLSDVAAECEQRGAKTATFFADVGDREKMLAVANEIIERFGVPQIVVANAGICPDDPEDYVTSNDPQLAMSTNYFGVINTFAGFIELMKLRRSGQLVAVSSVSALRATPNSAIYAASKSAVNMWTEGLRFRLKKFGIDVTVICPGFVHTEMSVKDAFYKPGIISAEKAAVFIATAIRKRRSRYFFPFIAKFIWKSFYLAPDWLYDYTITFARRNWPEANRKK